MRLLTLLPFVFALGAVADLQQVEFPHLIIPLKKSFPAQAFGTQTSGEISQRVWTEVSFDVPNNVPANICRINFHINTNPSKNAPRTLSGAAPYTFLVYRLLPQINKDTDSWDSHPKTTNYVATVTLTPSGGVTVEDGWFQCPLGEVVQFLLTPVGSRAFRYTWFELDYSSDVGGPHGITLEMHT